MSDDESLERLLRDRAERPQEEAFTQRVLAALPQRSRALSFAAMRRSWALASKLGIGLALLVLALRWYLAGTGGVDGMLPILLFLAPVLAAVARVCGPWVSRR